MSGNFDFTIDSQGLLRFPEGLESIPDHAFVCWRMIRALVLPKTVTSIGSRAFYGCRNLRYVRLSRSLREIGEGAFEGCKNLRRVVLPPGLREIGNRAFEGCESLRSVTLPPGLRSIGSRAFSGCSALSEADLPDSLEVLGKWAFSKCAGLIRARIPGSVQPVPLFAFEGCRGLADEKGFLIINGELTDYFGPHEAADVPEGVTRIGVTAFENCLRTSGRLRVSLPASVRAVAPSAFSQLELLIRVRRWFPDLTKALKTCRVTAIVTEDASLVPPEFRRALRIGRAFAPASSLDTPEAREDLAWLSRNAAALRKEAFRLPELLRFLCERKLIRPGSADAYLAEARARNDPELVSLLLSYQSELGQESMEKAREQKRRREDAALKARMRRAARDLKEGVEGLTFAVVGPVRVTGSRTELRRRLAERGARLTASVTASADYLVAVDPGNAPEKLEKAAELGIPLLTWEEFLGLLGPKEC